MGNIQLALFTESDICFVILCSIIFILHDIFIHVGTTALPELALTLDSIKSLLMDLLQEEVPHQVLSTEMVPRVHTGVAPW